MFEPMVTFEDAWCRQIIDVPKERKTFWSRRKWQVVLFWSQEAGEDIKCHYTKGEDEIIGGQYCHDESVSPNHYGLKCAMRKRRDIRREEGQRKSLVLIGSSHPCFSHNANVSYLKWISQRILLPAEEALLQESRYCRLRRAADVAADWMCNLIPKRVEMWVHSISH